MLLRNAACGFLALLIILSSRARNARKRALGGGVVTSIYFHKPNRRLFERCVRWLIKHGYTFISTKDLIEILAGGKIPARGAVWLSFDDGNKELLDDVLPLIRTCKIPVTLFIPSGIIEGNGLYPWIRREAASNGRFQARSFASEARHALTVDELQQLIRCEHITIGSHTVNHALTTSMTEERADVEFGRSKHTLECWAGTSVTSFAYPEGRYDGSERPFLKRFGYMLAATAENSFVTPHSDPYLVPRFSIGDDIPFPEAICNMVGVWRPVLDPLKGLFSRVRQIGGRFKAFSRRNICTTAGNQRDLQVTDK
jgi:peptidoglycan/xylan/chitin deacetylase (PgdA/CDA1 family)